MKRINKPIPTFENFEKKSINEDQIEFTFDTMEEMESEANKMVNSKYDKTKGAEILKALEKLKVDVKKLPSAIDKFLKENPDYQELLSEVTLLSHEPSIGMHFRFINKNNRIAIKPEMEQICKAIFGGFGKCEVIKPTKNQWNVAMEYI